MEFLGIPRDSLGSPRELGNLYERAPKDFKLQNLIKAHVCLDLRQPLRALGAAPTNAV